MHHGHMKRRSTIVAMFVLFVLSAPVSDVLAQVGAIELSYQAKPGTDAGWVLEWTDIETTRAGGTLAAVVPVRKATYDNRLRMRVAVRSVSTKGKASLTVTVVDVRNTAPSVETGKPTLTTGSWIDDASNIRASLDRHPNGAVSRVKLRGTPQKGHWERSVAEYFEKLPRLPDDPVAIGATWDEQRKLTMDLGGAVFPGATLDTHYTLNAVEVRDKTRVALIGMEGKVAGETKGGTTVEGTFKGTATLEVGGGLLAMETAWDTKTVAAEGNASIEVHRIRKSTARRDDKLRE